MRHVRLPRRRSVIRCALLAVGAAAAFAVPAPAAPQVKRYPLASPDGLRLQNVAADPGVLQGKKGLRVTMSGEGRKSSLSLDSNHLHTRRQRHSEKGLS